MSRVLITDMAQGRIWAENVRDPEEAQEQVFQAMRDTLSPVVRRTPAERLRATMEPLVADALAAYKATGHIAWPRSAELALADIATLIHDPTITSDQGGAEQVIRQGKALARYIAEMGDRQQAALDSKKVTLDWAGH